MDKYQEAYLKSLENAVIDQKNWIRDQELEAKQAFETFEHYQKCIESASETLTYYQSIVETQSEILASKYDILGTANLRLDDSKKILNDYRVEMGVVPTGSSE